MGDFEPGDQDSDFELDPVAFSWRYLRDISERERELARELDEVRDELYEQARAMKNAGVASVAQIADALGRNRQRVNAWMKTKTSESSQDKPDHDPDWIDPEGHLES
jgi:predicted XRE-type DNA-binding protein